jgi:hypothetical protein
MATTVGNFTAIDDTEVDAESPITESLVTRLRDNAYWVNEGTTQTSEGTGDKLLQTDGAGGVEWIGKDTVGVDGTKGSGSGGSTAGTIAILTDKILLINFVIDESIVGNELGAGGAIIDSSDDTYAGQVGTGTVTGTSSVLSTFYINAAGTVNITITKNGSNYEIKTGSNSWIVKYSYVWM